MVERSDTTGSLPRQLANSLTNFGLHVCCLCLGQSGIDVALRMPPLDGCHSSLVLRHWSLVNGYTRDLTSDARHCVVSTESNERAEETVSLDRGRSAPSHANVRNEQLFTPEIESPNNDQQEETTLGRPFRASSLPQAITGNAAIEPLGTTRRKTIPISNPRTKLGDSTRYRQRDAP